jgi:hypothetical protein
MQTITSPTTTATDAEGVAVRKATTTCREVNVYLTTDVIRWQAMEHRSATTSPDADRSHHRRGSRRNRACEPGRRRPEDVEGQGHPQQPGGHRGGLRVAGGPVLQGRVLRVARGSRRGDCEQPDADADARRVPG